VVHTNVFAAFSGFGSGRGALRLLPLIGGWQVAHKNVDRCAWTIREIVPPHVWQREPASP
jgi:hypothetical protein